MNEYKVRKIIRNILREYSSERRLPFDDDKFKNKNYLEQYKDWLEDFGRYGELSSSRLKFSDCVRSAVKEIVDRGLLNGIVDDIDSSNFRDILGGFAKIVGKNLVIGKDGNIYVERSVVIDSSASSYDKSEGGIDPMYLYKSLVRNYQNNVGGCWSYKVGGSESYCSMNGGDIIVMKGYIKVDDIDFVNTILLNFQYRDEHEIRVKPNAKVELFEVLFNCKYKVPLDGHLIVSATYFGNNVGYTDDYAIIDDGLGNYRFTDRNGNIISYESMIKIINSKLSNGVNPEDIFEYVENLGDGIKKVKFLHKWSIICSDGRLACGGNILFDTVYQKYGSVIKVELDNRFSFVTIDGNLIGGGKMWFDLVGSFSEGFFSVELDGKESFIDINGRLIGNGKMWFDYVSYFNEGFSIVKSGGKYSFIDKVGKLVCGGKLWFDKAYRFHDGFARVKLGNKWSFVDYNGRMIGGGKLWFDYAEDFDGGYATVSYGDMLYVVDGRGIVKKIGNMDDIYDELKDFVK